MGLFGFLGNLLSGGANNRIRRQMDQGYNQVNSRNNALYNRLQGYYPQAEQQANDLYGDIRSGVNNYVNTAGDPTKNPAYGTFDEFSHTGGVDPKLRGELERNFKGSDELAGWGKDFASTGGFSEGDKANFRARGTSNVPSFFSSLKDTLSTQNAAQGGFNPGYTSQMAKLARDQAHASQAAVRDTEAGLTEQINSNKLRGADVWGRGLAQGMSGRQSLLDTIARGREFGASGLAGLGQNADQARMAGLGILSNLRGQSPGFLDSLLRLTQGNIGATNQFNQNQLDNLFNEGQMRTGQNMGLLNGIFGLINPASRLLGGRKLPTLTTGVHPTGISNYLPPQ